MADETTQTGDVFVPEVYGDIAQAKFLGAVKVAGSPAVIEDNTLAGEPGERIHFPKWNVIDDELDDLEEGVAMETAKLGTSDSTAVIKEAGKAVEITSRAKLVALGNPENEATRQFGVMAARKVDSDLIAEAQAVYTVADDGYDSEPFQVPFDGAVASYDALLAGTEPFGDEFEPEAFAGVYCHSSHRTQLLKDENFLGAQELARIGATVARGQIGELAGVPVFFTDRLQAGKLLIIKRGVLGLLYKQRPIVERDRDILRRVDVVTTNLHYAVKRLDDRGVCVVTLEGDGGEAQG